MQTFTIKFVSNVTCGMWHAFCDLAREFVDNERKDILVVLLFEMQTLNISYVSMPYFSFLYLTFDAKTFRHTQNVYVMYFVCALSFFIITNRLLLWSMNGPRPPRSVVQSLGRCPIRPNRYKIEFCQVARRLAKVYEVRFRATNAQDEVNRLQTTGFMSRWCQMKSIRLKSTNSQ